MADFGRGIKAGAAVTTAYLVVSIIISVIASVIFKLTGISCESSVITAAGLSFPLELADPLVLTGSVFGRIVDGIIFGAVFAALYNLLPSTGTIKKALVFSSLLWLLVAVELVYTTVPSVLAYTPADASWSAALAVAGVHVSLPLVSGALAGFISAVVFGALTGFLWDRFGATGLAEARKDSGVLLVSFSLGIWMWASSAAGLIRYVVNEGALIIEPGPMWWANILHTLVASVGAAGWVLTLIAWRNTKRGQYGLKLGVAGGIMMAVTGIMLLPGALAITGGVLSRRKPVREPSTAAVAR